MFEMNAKCKFKSPIALVVLVSMLAVKCTKSATTDKQKITSDTFKNNCIYNEQEAERNPWTATLKLQIENATDYYACAILDEYTVLTYGRPFHFTTDDLAFLPWKNHTVLIGVVQNGTTITYSQSLEVSFIQPHPNYARRLNAKLLWMFAENDYIVIHLKQSIKFSSAVRPVCLPQLNPSDDNYINTEILNNLYSENTTAIIGGWKNYKDLERASLTVKLLSYEQCETEWMFRTRLKPKEKPYENRVCGFVSRLNTNNPGYECIFKDSGSLVNHNGRYTFLGFVNTLYSFLGGCNEQSFFFIFKLNTATIKWLNATIKCSSSQYACHNGDCAPLDSVCNKKEDGCSDGSDEDKKYCRALKPCTEDQFECGIYGDCIPKFNINGKLAQNCDGITDCPLNEDEQFCPETSPGIPPEKVISGVAIGMSLLIVLIIPIALLIWRRIKRNMRWKLTDEDIILFEDGLKCEIESEIFEIEKVYNKPFDSLHYEIDFDNIKKLKRIGGGYFADVYDGIIKNHGKTDISCAIKIPKSSADPEEVKGFLKELKIMAYVGKHENIINFIGAHTRRLREGILYIVVELCEFGSIEGFLKKHKLYFNNELKTPPAIQDSEGSSEGHYVAVEMVPMFKTTDLIRWASQIAAGMSHLASKQVVHGDLAARNILIDRNRIAKICDFGLSHHLYTNIIYIASVESRLPWKWMAVEALLDRALSTKSDVWAYGITLWELFTLGGDPYEGLEWNPSFPYSLSNNGCPLEQPEYASNKIFQIMRKCWAIDPIDRPTFNDIHIDWEDQLLLVQSGEP